MKHLIKTPAQIKNITDSCAYLTEMLAYIKSKTKAWMALLEVEELSEQWLNKRDLKGAFKGYDGFPANLCLSVNDCVVHGIPDETILKNGDLLKVDAGVIYQQGVSDSAFTMVIGDDSLNPLWAELIKVTKESLDRGIQEIVVGESAFAFSKAVYNHVKNNGFEVIKTLSGHGVGVDVHELPHIHNYPSAAMKKIIWKPGMVVALEPITAVESTDVVMGYENDRNLYCQKGDFWAQWEYTILITENGPKILAGLLEL